MRTRRIAFVVLLLALAVTLSGCSANGIINSPQVISGSGQVTTETRDVGGFTSVELRASGQMNITQGDTNTLSITADDNLLPLIKTTVRGGVLIIEFDRPTITFNPITRLQYDITVRKLEALTITGAGDFKVNNLNGESFKVNISGAGNITAAGRVTSQEVTLTGAGRYDADKLESDSATIEITGAGSASVWAKKTLDVNISGMGNVSYYGNPEVSRRVSGVGSVNGKGDKQSGGQGGGG